MPSRSSVRGATGELPCPVMSTADRQQTARARAKRAARIATLPVRRLLDTRFADTNRRLDATRLSLHEESNLTRFVIEQQLAELRLAIAEYTTVNAETLTFLATQVRQLQAEVESLSQQIDRLAAASAGAGGPSARE